MEGFFAILLSVLAVSVAVVAVIFLIVPLFKGLAFVLGHVFKFLIAVIADLFRFVGSVIAAVVFIPLVLANVVVGRWSAASHYGRAIQREFTGAGHCLYRVAVGHPARLLGLKNVMEGLEQRVPEAMANAPTSDKPSKRTGQFDGYKIVGSLKGGGSGAKIYVAEPDETKLASFARAGRADVSQVVVKSFSLRDGSSLPQIVRESRALEAAKKIGLVLEHDLNDQRFFYVMPYVPGDSLGVVTHNLHNASGPEGLTTDRMREVVGYAADLVRTLERYHTGGLWHKDVKPDNIIVHAGRAHLVDLGLVTPLSSGMTLTTHGTEYFRDPEMVRLALKGVKVHEVDGCRFDLYAAGAVLYSVLENSFPAHGGLSQVTKRCPETVRWIIRRAMTDYTARYATAAEMLADMNAVLQAADPFALRPIDLPSVRGMSEEQFETARPAPAPEPINVGAGRAPAVGAFAAAATAAAAPRADHGPRAGTVPTDPRPGVRVRPRLQVRDWWTGRYAAGPGDAHFAARAAGSPPPPRAHRPASGRPTAREQLASARQRVESRRRRFAERHSGRDRFDNKPNLGVAAALFIFLGACVAGVFGIVGSAMNKDRDPSHVIVTTEDWGHDFDAAFGPEFERAVEARVEDALRNAWKAEEGEELSAKIEDAGRRLSQRVLEISSRFAKLAEEAALAGASIEIGLGGTRIIADGDTGSDASAVVVDAGHEAVAAGVSTSASARPGAARAWLVLDDTRDRGSVDVHAAVQVALSRVKQAGWPLAGLDSSDRDIELLASARAAIGAGLPGNDRTQSRIGRWLEDRELTVAGLIWVELDEAGTRPVFHVFAPGRSDARKMARLLDRGDR